jgi:hypothetical protein
LAIGRASGSCRLTRPGRPLEGPAGQPLPGLSRDLPGRLEQLVEVVDRAGQPPTATTHGHVVVQTIGLHGFGLGACPAHSASGVDQQPLCLLGCGLGQVGEIPGHRRSAASASSRPAALRERSFAPIA